MEDIQPVVTSPGSLTSPESSAPEPQPSNQTVKTGTGKKKTPVTLVLVVIALILIAAAAYGAYKWEHARAVKVENAQAAQITSLNGQVSSLQKQLSSASTSSSSTTNPYVGWNVYSLKKEKLIFRYPTTWTLKDSSDTSNDNVLLSGPNNFQMLIGAGTTVSNVTAPTNPIVSADAATFNGKKVYLDAVSSTTSATGPISQIFLSTSATKPTTFPASTNIASSSVVVKVNYWGATNDSTKTQTLTYVKADTNYKDAVLVVESMTY